MNLAQFCSGIDIHPLDVALAKVSSRARTDIRKAIPLIHTEFSDTDFDVQPVVVLDVDSPFAKSFPLHILMCLLTALDFGYQSSSSLCEFAHKSFVPKMLVLITPSWPLASSNTHEYTNLATGPLVYACLVQYKWGWVVLSCTFIDEYRLSDLNGLECQANCRSCAPCLPDLAIELWGRFLS